MSSIEHLDYDDGTWGWDRDCGAWLVIGHLDQPFEDWFALVDDDFGAGTGKHMVGMAMVLAEAGYGGGNVTVGLHRPGIWATDAQGEELTLEVVDRADQIVSLSGRTRTQEDQG